MQQMILDRIEAAGEASLNRLCWDLAAAEGPATPSITPAFHSSFHRAVRSLIRQHFIRARKVVPTNIDALIDVYPYRTRDAAVKEMRHRLLPVAKAYLAWRQARKYSPADNERHAYRQLGEDVRTDAARRWERLEPSLFATIAVPDERIREAALGVLVRGRQLFVRAPVRHRAAFTALAESLLAAAGEHLPGAAAAELRGLLALFPAPLLAQLKLKTDLYEVAQLGRQFHQHVKNDFIEYLMREAPDVMRAMPGFRASGSERTRPIRLPHRDEPSPLVQRLVRRDVGKPFIFLSFRTPRAASGPAPALATTT
jgi:hypothetical protein